MQRPVFDSHTREEAIPAIALGLASILIGWTIVTDLDLRYAWGGWSATDWLNHRNMPENFSRDFPSGVEAYEKSAFLQIYPLAERWLGITAEVMQNVVVAVELLVIALASCLLASALFNHMRLLIGVTLFVLLVASAGPNLDLARFGMPYAFGLYYYVAEASRIAAIAFAMRRQYAASGLLLGLAAATHPVMAFYAGVFIVAMMALEPREIISRGALSGATLFALIALPWFFARFLFDPGAGLLAGEPPHELWLPLMVAFSYHFFPVQLGLFAELASERFLPLFSYFALFAHYATRVDLPRDLIQRLAAGMLAMAVVTFAGIVLSAYAPSPFMVKLAPHRASLVAVLVAMPVVVAGLWQDMLGASLLRRFFAAGALFSAFFFQPGWPLLFTAVLCITDWKGPFGGRGAPGDRIATGLILTAAALAVFYDNAGLVAASADLYWANPSVWKFAGIFLVLSVLCGWLAAPGSTRTVAGLVLMLSACATWLAGHALTAEQTRLYADFKAAQLWARDQTPRTALFMVDPTIYYGWRDFSQRSSFGNLREWLHTSWVYSSNTQAFLEGYRRFGEFGIALGPYLNQRPSASKGANALTAKIGQRFNSADDSWRRSLAAKYDIDYFVVNKRDWKADSELPVAFENGSFRILLAPPENAAR